MLIAASTCSSKTKQTPTARMTGIATPSANQGKLGSKTGKKRHTVQKSNEDAPVVVDAAPHFSTGMLVTILKVKRAAARIAHVVDVRKISKDVHARLLGEQFRAAMLTPPAQRTAAELTKLARIFGLCPNLQNISNEALFAFCSHCECSFARDGERIVTEGQEPDKYYIIALGYARVLMRSVGGMAGETGEIVVVRRLGPGNSFGEAGLIFDQPRSATIQAEGNVILASLPRDAYIRILSRYHIDKYFFAIQKKINFLELFSAWRHYELRPKFTVAYFLNMKHVHAEPNTDKVIYDRQRPEDAFDHRFWKLPEQFPPSQDLLCYLVSSGECKVLAEFEVEVGSRSQSHTMVVSTLSVGAFFGGPCCATSVARVVARMPVELYEVCITRSAFTSNVETSLLNEVFLRPCHATTRLVFILWTQS